MTVIIDDGWSIEKLGASGLTVLKHCNRAKNSIPFILDYEYDMWRPCECGAAITKENSDKVKFLYGHLK